MSVPLPARNGPWQPVLALPGAVHIVQCCTAPLAKNLVAIATDQSVYAYAIHTNDAHLQLAPVASFFLGAAVYALAWSPGAQYPNAEGEGVCRVELLVATADKQLRLLRHDAVHGTEMSVLAQSQTPIHDLDWCATPGYEQYVAAAGGAYATNLTTDDGSLQIWDLEPEHGVPECHTMRLGASILSVSFHAKVPKLLLAVDASGVGRLIDWLASISPECDDVQTAVTFSDPSALAANVTQGICAMGGAAWQPHDPDVVGALLGTRWCVWNLASHTTNPTRPSAHGAFQSGPMPSGGGIRFCPTNARLFALHIPAAVQIFDASFPTSPRAIDVHDQAPFRGSRSVDLHADSTSARSVRQACTVGDVDWAPFRVGGYDVLFVAVGRQVLVVPAS
ncbi:hypothetical protein MVES1_002292 [Malassezia vespertilionis]|uniref:uncharacterized protein n=1 Tax=Malassezia vespertilionis TaxID=2020962 RepID=UPI0024B0C576|nr:uncharacterized protein MVES1_002292 [Malassezia vespertilionis]WFD06937.1 hypothetical protein MVES1_002292 [Malassezia vespertilionis]